MATSAVFLNPGEYDDTPQQSGGTQGAPVMLRAGEYDDHPVASQTPPPVNDGTPPLPPAVSSGQPQPSPQPTAMFRPYTPTLMEQMRGAVANSAIGHALQSNQPAVAHALGLEPTERYGTPDERAHEQGQMLAPEYLAPAITKAVRVLHLELAPLLGPEHGVEQPNTAGENRLRGALHAAGGLTTIPNLEMAAAAGPVEGLIKEGISPVAAHAISRLAAGGFTLQMIKGLYDQHKAYRDAVNSGDIAEAQKIQGEMGVNAAMALMTASHATGAGEAAGRYVSERAGARAGKSAHGETPAAPPPPPPPPTPPPNVEPVAGSGDVSRGITAAADTMARRRGDTSPAAATVAPADTKPLLHDPDASVDELRASAERQAPALGDAVARAAEGVPGARVEAVREAKDADRIGDKAERQEVAPSQIGDVLAAKVTVPDQAAADTVLKNLNREMPVDNREGGVTGAAGKNGVRQVQATVDTNAPAGEAVKKAEVLVQTPEMATATDRTHDGYRKAQELRAAGDEAGAQRLEAELQREHEGAEQAARERLAKPEATEPGKPAEQRAQAPQRGTGGPPSKGETVLLYGRQGVPDGTPATVEYWNRAGKFHRGEDGTIGTRGVGRVRVAVDGKERLLNNVQEGEAVRVPPVAHPSPVTGTPAERAMLDRVQREGPALVGQYLSQHTTDGVPYIARDSAKELFDEYRQDPTMHNRDADAAAGAISTAARRVQWSRPPRDGHDVVAIATGTPASGKTTNADGAHGGALEMNLESIFDSVANGRALVDEILAADRRPLINLFYVDEPRTNAARMLDRAAQNRRVVPLDYMAGRYREIPRIVAELQRVYGDRLTVNAIDNSGAAGEEVVHRGTVAPAVDATARYTEEEVREAMDAELRDREAAGTVSDAIAREARQQATKRETVSSDQPRGERGDFGRDAIGLRAQQGQGDELNGRDGARTADVSRGTQGGEAEPDRAGVAGGQEPSSGEASGRTGASESQVAGRRPADGGARQAQEDQLGPNEQRPSKQDLEDVGQKPMFARAGDAGPIWYRKSERLIREKIRGPMTGEQVLRMLENGGVKADELKWTGLPAFLQGKFRVTPDELLQQIADGALRIEEVMKGGQQGEATKFGSYQLPRAEPNSYRELLLVGPDSADRAPAGSRAAMGLEPGQDFRSSHWDEPNVLAHIRFNDRIGADGQRLLHIEEIQSDWHQKGRDVGYRGEPGDTVEDAKRFFGITDERWSRMDIFERRAYFDEMRSDEPYITQGIKKQVPDAPFKKDWQEMAFRRMVKYAADNGYDGVSWTPGEEQAKRYDLSKQVDRVVYRPGGGTLKAYKGDRLVIDKTGIAPEQVPDYLGKEVARKLMAPENTVENPVQVHELVGQQLSIGGDGMKGFYDKIIPDYARKFGKPWGAKVGETEIGGSKEDRFGRGIDRPGVKVPFLEITPAMRKSVAEEGVAMFKRDTDPQAAARRIMQADFFLMPADGPDAPMVHIDGGVRQALNDLEPALAQGGAWEGATLPKPVADKIVQKIRLKAEDLLRNGFDAAAGRMDRLAATIDRARDAGGNAILMTLKGLASVAHEQFHGWQARKAAHLGDVMLQVSEHPAVQKAAKALERVGYSGGTTEAVQEATARAFDGDWHSAGLNEGEARSLLTDFLHAVVKVRGPEALDDLPGIKREIADLVDEVRSVYGRGKGGAGQDQVLEREGGGPGAGAGGGDAAAADRGERGERSAGVPGREDARGAGAQGGRGDGGKPPADEGQQRLFQQGGKPSAADRITVSRGDDGTIRFRRESGGGGTQLEEPEERLLVTAQELREGMEAAERDRQIGEAQRGRQAELAMRDKEAAYDRRRAAEEAERDRKRGDAAGAKGSASGPGSSPLDRLRENVAAKPKVKMTAKQVLAETAAESKRNIERSAKLGLDALAKAQQDMADGWEEMRNPSPTTDYMKAYGTYELARTENALNQQKLAAELTERVPSRARRVAMSNWIQAGGDRAKLEYWAKNSKPELAKEYRLALDLTPDEIAIARAHQAYFDQQERIAKEHGFIEQGKADYLMQIYEGGKNDGLRSQVNYAALRDDPGIFERSAYRNYFEAESAGHGAKNKDLGYLTATYDKSFGEAIRSRALIRQLLEGRAKDGRPLAILESDGHIMQIGPENEPYLMTYEPKDDGADPLRSDYETINHPAMRQWYWQAGDLDLDDAKPSEVKMYQSDQGLALRGNVRIHPEAVDHLTNFLRRSAIDTMGGPTGTVARGYRGISQAVKSAMFTLSGTHQIIETTNAVQRGVVPINFDAVKKTVTLKGWANPFKLDDSLLELKHPDDRLLVANGLTLMDFPGEEAWSQGIANGPLKVVPGTNVLAQYHDYLFHDLIPKMKVAVGRKALTWNRMKYPELDRDKVAAMTAAQVNQTFGGMNWKRMGVDPTAVDVARMVLLAPDFQAGKIMNMADLVRKRGGYQRTVFLRGALAMYGTARVLNYLLNDGDAKWDAADAFSLVYKGKRYSIRTEQGDQLSLLTDPRKYVAHRENPMLRSAVEMATGKDEFGRAKTLPQTLKDAGTNALPLALQSALKNQDIDWSESFLSSAGVTAARYYTPAEDAAHKLRIAHLPQGAVDADDQSREARRMKDKLRSGEMTTTELWNAVKEGKIAPERAGRIQSDASLTKLQEDVKALSLTEALDVYQKANVVEQGDLRPIIAAKAERGLEELEKKDPDKVPKVLERLQKMQMGEQ